MAKTIFNTDKVDFTKQNMFFGADMNTQRYDTFKFPVFDKLNQMQFEQIINFLVMYKQLNPDKEVYLNENSFKSATLFFKNYMPEYPSD